MQSFFSLEKENLINMCNFTPSAPIPIINSNRKCNSSYNNLKEEDDLVNDEYILNSNIFNPSKMSPPNEWKNRLKNRIRIYFSSDSDLNIEKYK